MLGSAFDVKIVNHFIAQAENLAKSDKLCVANISNKV